MKSLAQSLRGATECHFWIASEALDFFFGNCGRSEQSVNVGRGRPPPSSTWGAWIGLDYGALYISTWWVGVVSQFGQIVAQYEMQVVWWVVRPL